MISVVLSAINPGLLGYKAVMSCLRSLPIDSEVILHLDPSEERECARVRSIADRRFRLIETAERVGFAEGLNLAISEAKFNLIARHDADDIALPWRWRYQVQKMSELDFHFGSMLHLYKTHGVPLIFPHFPVFLTHDEFAAVATFQNPGFHPAVMFKRDSFLEVGGYRNAVAEDYDLWLRMLAAGKRVRRDLLPVTLYRHHPTQSTANPDWERKVELDPLIRESRGALSRQLPYRKTEPILKKLFRRQPLSTIEFRRIRSADR